MRLSRRALLQEIATLQAQRDQAITLARRAADENTALEQRLAQLDSGRKDRNLADFVRNAHRAEVAELAAEQERQAHEETRARLHRFTQQHPHLFAPDEVEP